MAECEIRQNEYGEMDISWGEEGFSYPEDKIPRSFPHKGFKPEIYEATVWHQDGTIHLEGDPTNGIKINPETYRRVLPRVLDGQTATIPCEVMGSAAPVDLKPRGEKTQWWLFPFLALSEVEDEAPVFQVARSAAQDGPQTASNTLARLYFPDVVTALGEAMRVFEYGARKYSPDNWRKAHKDGMLSFRREYFSAMIRHLMADATGEELDPESGLPHRAHALCGCLMWAWQERREAGEIDERSPFHE